MTERDRRRVWLGVALGHLTIAALGAASADLSCLGALGRMIERYGSLSGADYSYGFFAPGVGGQLRATFEVIDAGGRRTLAPIATGASHEADLRVGDIIDRLAEDDEDSEEIRTDLAASLAGAIFGRHPEAASVTVRLDWFEPVSMEAFRLGARPAWSPRYAVRFQRGDEGVTESKDEISDLE